MQSTPFREFIVGLFVLGGLLAVGYLSFSLGGAAYGGGGMELRAPLAVTVITGLTASTLLTLLVIPVVYSLTDRRRAHARP